MMLLKGCEGFYPLLMEREVSTSVEGLAMRLQSLITRDHNESIDNVLCATYMWWPRGIYMYVLQ